MKNTKKNNLNMNFLLDFIFEDLSQGMVVCDTNGKIILYNKVHSDLDKMSAENVLNKDSEEVYNFLGTESLLKKVLKTKKSFLCQRHKYTTLSGITVDSIVDAHPIMDEGELLGAYVLTRDFSEAKEYADGVLKEILSDKRPREKKFLDFSKVKFQSKAMLQNMDRIEKNSRNFKNISIFGEAGTERREIAEYIVKKSNASKGSVSFDCGTVSPDAQFRVLFGDGSTQKDGLLQNVGERVLIIENLDYLSLITQASLADYLYKNKLNIIAIYSKMPNEIFKENKLQIDLFYMLNEVYMHLPPLRERPRDVREYILEICRYISKTEGKTVNMSYEVHKSLLDYHWQGNFSELVAVLSSAIEVSDGDMITLSHLPSYICHNPEDEEKVEDLSFASLNEALENTERTAIKNALERHGGNISRACVDLAISRQNLQYRIRKLNI